MYTLVEESYSVYCILLTAYMYKIQQRIIYSLALYVYIIVKATHAGNYYICQAQSMYAIDIPILLAVRMESSRRR